MNRRRFLVNGLCAGVVLTPRLNAFSTREIPVVVDRSKLGRSVPETLTGLSYELAQLTDPAFFSAPNTNLVSFFRRLSPQGVLRIGGNTSEFCWFKADENRKPPELHVPKGDVSKNWMPHRLFPIEPKAIDNLQSFLAATGWRVIYGLNFGNSNPSLAAEHAAYAYQRLKDRVLFFQIGNEPDFYRDANNGTRPAGWGFKEYVREWVVYANAITERVPQAKFGGPDTGASSDWVTHFGESVAPLLGSRLVSLTGHYYAEGPPDNPAVTTERLLTGDPSVASTTAAIVHVADAHDLTYRMTEGNSCYRGGKPGMSNAFAASLWAADYILELASLGCAGINLHGGSSGFLSAGLGDHNPGIAGNAEHPKRTNGFYTPISTEEGEAIRATPVYYGMMFAQAFAETTMLEIEHELAPMLRAYAGVRDGKPIVGIVNKSSDQHHISLDFRGFQTSRFARLDLSAPSLKTTEGVTFGGSDVDDATASWTPHDRTIHGDDGRLKLLIPPTQAVLLRGL